MPPLSGSTWPRVSSHQDGVQACTLLLTALIYTHTRFLWETQVYRAEGSCGVMIWAGKPDQTTEGNQSSPCTAQAFEP